MTDEITENFADRTWRLCNLYWIIDQYGQKVKFAPNATQMDLLQNMSYMNVILKARQLGFTTFIQIYMLDACVFNSNTKAGIIAQTAEAATAFFADKVKFPYDNLPQTIKDAVPLAKSNTTELVLGNNSSLRVGVSLRSSTFNILHVSEYGKICAKDPERAREIRTGAFNTVHAGQIIFVESTAEGQEGDFYDMCQAAMNLKREGAKLTALDFKFHFYPWWEHPDYTIDPEGVLITQPNKLYFNSLGAFGIELTEGQQAWYAKKLISQGDDMRREFPSHPDEAFQAGIDGAYYSKQMAHARDEGRITKVPYTPALRVETWWDLGMRDSMAIWFIQRHGPQVRVIDYYEASGEGLPHYATVLKEKGYSYDLHIAPHDIVVREIGSGMSRLDAAHKLGIDFSVAPMGGVADGIESVRGILSTCWFDAEKCDRGIKCLDSYKKEWNDKLGRWKDKPLHNWASHGADAFRTGASVPDTVMYEDEEDYFDDRYGRDLASGY